MNAVALPQFEHVAHDAVQARRVIAHDAHQPGLGLLAPLFQQGVRRHG